MSDIFRVGIETTDNQISNYDQVSAGDARQILANYIDRSGDGLRMGSATGLAFWAWDKIHAVRIIRGSYTVEDYP